MRRDRLGLFRLRIEPRVVDLEKNPLRPFVIAGIGRVDLAFPIVGKTDPFQLRFELRDILARGDGGMLPGFDGVLLRRQTERVPAHRMENVETVQPLVARDDVGGGVTFRMADVQSGAARIGKHIEHVELRLRRIEIFFARIQRVKGPRFVPDGLPLRLEAIEWVRFATLVHRKRIRKTGKQEKNKNLLRSSFPNSFCRMRQLLLATRNTHKVREFSEILGRDFVVHDLSEEPDAPAIEETGSTFAENAILKAIGISQRSSELVVADDSGLEVDALDGAPGIFSARYAGPRATDAENIARLLSELGALAKGQLPAARFRCVLALARKGELLGTFEGAIEGVIVPSARGRSGFGYDPIFQPNGFVQTFAELSAVEKNEISHRALAIRLLRARLA